MRYNIHFLRLLLLLVCPQWAQAQIYTWSNGLPSSGDQEILCSALDPSGNLVVAGKFGGTVDFDPSATPANRSASGDENAFIAKYTPAGALLWAKSIKNNSNNSSGNNSRIKGIHITPNGDIYVAGSFNGEIDFNPDNNSARESSDGTNSSNDDLFIARYTSNGVYSRHLRRGSTQNDEATGIMVYQNKVYVIGTYKTVAQGFNLNQVDFSPGNFNVFRSSRNNSVDGFIARYDLNFSYETVETFGGNNDDFVHSLAIDNTGAILIAGRTSDQITFQGLNSAPANGNADAYLVKYTVANANTSSPSINYAWGFTLGGPSRKEAYAVAVDAANNIYLGGRYDQTFDADLSAISTYDLQGNGSFNSFLIKYDNLGNFQAATSLSDNAGTGYESIQDIKVTNNNLYFTGVYGGTVSPFNGSTPLSPITAVGNVDVLVGRCDLSLNYDWVFGIGSLQGDTATSIAVIGTDFYVSGIYRDDMDCDPDVANNPIFGVGGNDMFFAKYSVCLPPTTPALATSVVSVCQGSTTRFIRTGGTLGSSPRWEWFANNCSGTPIAIGDTLNITVTTPSTYYVRSASGCAAPSTCAMATVFMDSTPTATIAIGDITDARCAGGNSGRLSVTPQGGRPFYRYLWSAGGDTTSFSDSLSAGTYTVTVTDANQCSTTASAVVGEPLPLAGTINVGNVSCSGSRNGRLEVIPTGGTPNYTYAWSTNPARTTAIIDSLSGGNFQVAIRDANGCTTTLSSSVNEPAMLESMLDTANTSNPSTCAGNDGQLAIATSGGIMPYTFVTTGQNPTNSNIITNVGAGIYNISISDANGCSNVITHTLTEPSAISISTESTNITCFSGAQGTLIATPSGGTEPYSYLWVNSMGVVVSNNDTATNIPAGAYSVTVTDDLYCSNFTAVTLSQPSALNDTIEVTDASCLDCTDGAAVVILQGGTPPYTYLWSDGRTSAFRANMVPGIYILYVSDSSGCSDTLSITIGFTTPLHRLENTPVQIFPNPTRGLVYVKNLPVRRRLFLVNALGQIVWRDENQYSDTQIDMHALPAATYWLRIETDTDAVQIPLVKSNE